MSTFALADAQDLSRSPLVKGVIGEILTIDAWWHLLPFEPVVGGVKIYTRELAAPTASWRAVGDSANRTQGTVTQVTTTLKMLEGTAEVDDKLKVLYSDTNSIMSTAVMLKAKAMWREFKKTSVTGDTSVDANSFDGIRALCAASQYVDNGTTPGSPLSLALLDEVMSKVLSNNGQVDFGMMGIREMRNLYKIARTLPGADIKNVQIAEINGKPFNVLHYNGVPIFRNDWATATETINGVGDKARLWYGAWGEGVGLTGLLPADLDELMTLGAPFTDKGTVATFQRIEMFGAMACYSTKALAGAKNILSTISTE